MPKPRVLDESSIQAVRERFNRQRILHWNSRAIDFDQIFELLGNDCISFAEIAKRFGLSRERLRQLYEKYFASLFPNRPCGRARQKICVQKTNLQRAQDFSDAPAALRKIAEIAQAHEYSIQKIPSSISGNRVSTFSTTTMLINGKVCTICCLKNIISHSPYNKLSYTRFKLTRTRVEKYDFAIVVRQIGTVEQVFVVPAKILLKKWGGGSFYIPERETPVYRKLPRINFWQYLDAWHLLADQ